MTEYKLWLLFLCPVLSLTEVVSVKVKVDQGWLEGEQLELVTKDGYYTSFKGIPYAAPPVGELRFQAPQPPIPWDKIRNATTHGPVCIQFDSFKNKFINESEDCLFLNVYTLNMHPNTCLPVMVFIHGGGFQSGSGNDANYGPDFLVQNGVVLVTFNYRLDVLGFLSLETEDVPGNAGMRDQVAALKWVKKNIHHFGGDPDNVTIFGQSAGGVSTILHMISPMSKGLFNKVISMSGVPSCDWALASHPRRRAFALGKLLGLDTKDPKKLHEFLLKVPASRLIGKRPAVYTSEEITRNTLKMFPFTPVIEKDFGQKRFSTDNPDKIIKKGTFGQVDVMIGRVAEEGISLLTFEDSLFKTYSQYADMVVPRKILLTRNIDDILGVSDMIQDHYFGSKPINKDTIREFLSYINDSTFNYDIYRLISKLSKVLYKKIFVYKFSAISKRNIHGKLGEKYNLTGPSHLDDTAHLFDPKNANLEINKSSKEYKIVQQITKLFTNFAKYGNPTPDSSLGVDWPSYNNETKIYMDIGEELKHGKALDYDAAAFWKTVFNKVGLEFYFAGFIFSLITFCDLKNLTTELVVGLDLLY